MTAVEADYDAVLEEAETELDAVDAALGRLVDETYGMCVVCGEPIPDQQLADRPTAVSCGRHEQAAVTSS